MKKQLLTLIPLLLAGCASQADYQTPADHPANAGADANPPAAADPFEVEGRPVEAQADPDMGGMDMGNMNDMDMDNMDMNGMDMAASDYPLDTCPVTGAKLGSMGEPIDVEVQGRIVKVCCGGCVAAVKADPEKYLAMLDAAADGDADGDTERDGSEECDASSSFASSASG